ncbi:MAG: hypothetical protein CMH60_02370 [Myxococcales bacterium]|nr:hypothetical protein [Myxococcales bacterium]|tara:strand:+ start:563 stop:1711 length:1149 start_codon:yes stop_codon:yes gene_type:complete
MKLEAKTILTLCVILTGTACQEANLFGPQTVLIYGFNKESQEYNLHESYLETLENARRIRGQALKMRGGAIINVETLALSGDLDLKTEEQAQNFDLVSADGPVWAQYEVRNDVLHPTDWESLLMFSFYHHVEKGLAFYETLGVPESARGQILTHFQVRVSSLLLGGLPLIGKNAAYTPVDDAFLLFPDFTESNRIPLLINEGVVVHELSHAIKHRIIHGENRLPIPLRDQWENPALNAYNSDDEGIADFFSSLYTNDPDFIRLSIKDKSLDRDIAIARPFSQELYDNMQEDSLGYDPYPLGSAIASWLYAIGDDETKRTQVAQALVQTLINLEPQLNANYHLHTLTQALIANLPDDLAEAGCNLLDERLQGNFREGAPCAIQ